MKERKKEERKIRKAHKGLNRRDGRKVVWKEGRKEKGWKGRKEERKQKMGQRGQTGGGRRERGETRIDEGVPAAFALRFQIEGSVPRRE